MPEKSKKNSQIKQPNKKKKRVNSQNGTKGQSQSAHTDNVGVSTANFNASQSPNTHSIGASMLQNFMSNSSLQTPQPMQFPGAMQTLFPYSPPPQGMGSPFNLNQQAQAQAQMNFRPDWTTEMIETVKAMSKELEKLSTMGKNYFWYQNICAELRI